MTGRPVARKTARSPTCGNKPTLLSVSPQCHADFFVPYNLIRRQNQGYRQLLGYHSPCQESAGLTDVMIVAPATISPAWRRSPAFTTAAMATTRCRMVPKTKRKGLHQVQGQQAVMNKESCLRGPERNRECTLFVLGWGPPVFSSQPVNSPLLGPLFITHGGILLFLRRGAAEIEEGH
jgi:hypothetical protein